LLSTYIGSGDASELHGPLDVGELLALGNEVVHVLKDTSGDGPRVSGVGVEGLDDLLDGDGGVAGSPGVKVGRSADERVATISRKGDLATSRWTLTRARPLGRAWPRG
jgi:hypothetical protein